MTLVLKVDCRACSRECGDYKHLQDETVIDDESTTLAGLLNYCTTLECFVENRDHGMPEHICNSCVEHLLQSYLFKEMVLQNDKAFRERLKIRAEEQRKSMQIIKVVGSEQFVEQEIDVGGVEEQNLEEFIAENEENVASTNATEADFEINEDEEWLEIEEVAESAIPDLVAKEEIVEEAENISEQHILSDPIQPDRIDENEIKSEDDETNSRFEIVDEDGGFIITTTAEELENNSDSGEALQGFEDSQQNHEGDENIEEQENADIPTETNDEVIPKAIKRRFTKVRKIKIV